MENQTETNLNQKNIGGGLKWYQWKIIKKIKHIEDIQMLKYLDRFIELFLKKWG